MRELLNRRQENSKTYDLGGHKRVCEISIGAIHYKDNYADKSEQWKDIDLTIVNGRVTKVPYELTVDGQKLTLRDKKTGEVSTIELSEVKPTGLKWEIIPEYSAVRFRHILPSNKIPFEAKFKVTGKIPFMTRASDDEDELPLEAILKDGILTERLSFLPRPAKGNIRIDPTWQVGVSSDDCLRQLSLNTFDLTGVFRAGAHLTTSNYQMGDGARFTNITIPKGSTINQAYLTLRCSGAKAGTTVKTRISAEKIDNAPTFANDAAAFDARWANRTTARVNWDNIPAWTLNTNYNSPEIKTVIQEIINRAGWASGNALVIFWEDFEDRSTHAADCYRPAYSYDTSTTYAPKLYIGYTMPIVVFSPIAEKMIPADRGS